MAKVAKKQPLILITNDDGVTAPGIKALVEVASKFGKVVVVAPDSPQSGMGHAITIGKPLRLNPVSIFEGIDAYQCTGTPVDCVKLANDIILERKPDICLSGINHGSNASINVIYSGTMSAAMEASIEGIPSAGFSYLDYSFSADFTVAKKVVEQVIPLLLKQKLNKHFLLNVNIPICKEQEFKGVKLCKQANAKWQENFVQRQDPQGKNYFWLTGEFVNNDKSKETDIYALSNNYASIVPVQYDLTDYAVQSNLKKDWEKYF